MQYEDIIEPRGVYSLLALTAFRSGFFGLASRAFIKLESLTTLSASETEAFRDLAFSIFLRNRPHDPSVRSHSCPNPRCDATVKEWDTNCMACGTVFAPCVLTGASIRDQAAYKCPSCRRKMLLSETIRRGIHCCPLCHAAIQMDQLRSAGGGGGGGGGGATSAMSGGVMPRVR